MKLTETTVSWGNMLEDITLPQMMTVSQHFEAPRINDIPAHVRGEMERIIGSLDLHGKSVAIPIGSRGIHDIDVVLRAVVDYLKEKGAEPFIFPAMGTHGNATAEGQLQIAKGAGVTEETMGCPIRATMETVIAGALENGSPVHVDKYAAGADAIIVVHKVKPHADFKAEHESGLAKMLMIGMGNYNAPNTIHRWGFAKFGELLPQVAGLLVEKLPVIMGLGIVENPYGDLMCIDGCPGNELLQKDAELLRIAKKNVATVLLRNIDVLIVEEIGKNISGAGMDPNVIGRPGSELKEGFEDFGITRIVALDLTEASNRNGTGIGLADFTTKACLEKIDLGLTYTSSLPTNLVLPSKIPITLDNDRLAILTAIKSSCPKDLKNARVIRIKNTKELDVIQVSEALREEVLANPRLKILKEGQSINFDENDMLIRDAF